MCARFSGGFLRFLVLLVLLGAGCAKPSPPESSLVTLKVRAEQRLYQDARQTMLDGQYLEAAVLFQHFLTNHPHSSLRPKANWWLARSYQKAGELRLALQQYRILVRTTSTGPYHKEAKLRISEIESLMGYQGKPHPSIKALVLSEKHFNGIKGVNSLFEKISREDYSTLIITVECPSLDPVFSSGQGYPARRSWTEWIQDLVEPIVIRSHKNSQEVMVGIPLRCLGRFQGNVEWNDWYYAPLLKRLRPSVRFDLFHPNYQDFLFEHLVQLSTRGIDGLVFLAESALGPAEGFSSWGIQGFEQAFDVPLVPKHLFHFNTRSQVTRFQEGDYFPEVDASVYRPLFWRWSGWKARERLQVIRRLRARLKKQAPQLQYGIEIHQETVVDPVNGLVRFSEDWLETVGAGFHFILVKEHSPGIPVSNGMATSHGSSKSWNGFVQEMVQVAGDPSKVWIQVPAPPGRGTYPVAQLNYGRSSKGIEEKGLPKGVGEVIEYVPVP